MAEFHAMLNEFRTDYNKTHFVRNESFKKAADNITGPARKIFIEFLERSCTAEFSGFLLYKELGRRLKNTNPTGAALVLTYTRAFMLLCNGWAGNPMHCSSRHNWLLATLGLYKEYAACECQFAIKRVSCSATRNSPGCLRTYHPAVILKSYKSISISPTIVEQGASQRLARQVHALLPIKLP